MAHVSDYEQIARAKEIQATVESLLSGAEQGATSEIEKISLEVEAGLQKRAEVTGSRPIGHAVDVLKAQRLLVTKKDLGDRFLRISKRLEELRANADPRSPDVLRIQTEIDSLRPLLRLVTRSEAFRKVLLTALRVTKHAIEENVEASEPVEDVLEKAENEGMEEAAEEAKVVVSQVAQNISEKLEKGQDVISEKDWDKLSEDLHHLFNKLRQHSEFRKGIEQIFTLASTLSTVSPARALMGQTRTERARKVEKATEGLQTEAKDLVAQFSGEEELEALLRSLTSITKKLENDVAIQKWWAKFKNQTMHIASNYQGKKDIKSYQQVLKEGMTLLKEHKNKIIKIADRLQVVIDNITNDELVTKLRDSLATLTDDLFWQDQEGNRFFDQDAAGILASSVGSVIRHHFKYLALPRIEKIEDGAAYTLDNLTITATLPDKIDFHLESYGSLDTSAVGVSGQSSIQTEIYLTATIRGIALQAPNIHFTYNGTISDAGVMTVTIPPPGADLAIDFVMRPAKRTAISAPTGQTSDIGGFLGAVGGAGSSMRYELIKVNTHFYIPDMDIEYEKQTLSHSVLMPLLTSLFKVDIVDRFERGVEESLNEGLNTLGNEVIKILNQAPNPLSISSFGSMMTAL